MHPSDHPAQGPRSAPDPEALLGDLAAALLEDLDQRGTEVAEAVQDRLPFYRDSPAVGFADLQESCTANLRFVIRAIGRREPADPAPAALTGTRRAEAAVPLATVIDAYRIGFHVVWEQVVAVGQRLPLPAETLLSALSSAMSAHDVYVQEMSRAYHATLTARLLIEDAERSALVEAVLTGTLTDRRTLWEAADLLRLPLDGPYFVVAAELPSPGRLALPEIESKLVVEGLPSAWRLLPDHQVGIVAVTPERTDRMSALLRENARGPVGLSPAFDDLTRAGQALEWARLTLASAVDAPGVSRFEENPIGIAAVASPEVMQRVALDVLAPLQAAPESERDTLMETLRAWVAAGGSTRKTAKQLSCHPNTVRYRLRRVEERTGRHLHQPTDAAAICLALEVVSAGERAEG